MFKILSLALALFVIGESAAAAAEWRLAAFGGQAPDRQAYFVDATSVVRNGDSVRFWTQTIAESVGDGDWDRSLTLREGSCSALSSAVVQNSFYRSGRLVDADTERQQSIVHAPETMMEGVMLAVCGREAYLSEAVGDPEGRLRAFYRDNR